VIGDVFENRIAGLGRFGNLSARSILQALGYSFGNLKSIFLNDGKRIGERRRVRSRRAGSDEIERVTDNVRNK